MMIIIIITIIIVINRLDPERYSTSDDNKSKDV